MKKFLSSFKKYFIYYGVWTIIAVLVITFEFSLLTQTKDEEKVDILINSYTFNEDEFNEIINANRPDYLKEVNYRYNDSTNGLLGQVMQTYGAVEADLYILSKDVLDNNMSLSYYFLRLDQNICNEVFNGTYSYYFNEGFDYGIKINPSFIDDEEKEYYLLFANDSLHLGSLNDCKYDGVITLAKGFLA